MEYQVRVYRREMLYEEVWASPVTKVAMRYGVSDAALRKTCRKLAVPLPPLGYWVKLQFGKAPPRPPLPPHNGPEELRVERRMVEPGAAAQVEAQPDLVRQREFEAKPENKISVPQTLHRAHVLVAHTQIGLKKPLTDTRGMLSPRGERVLQVTVSQASTSRALRILSALLTALEGRGFLIRFEQEHRPGPSIRVLGEPLSFRLTERTRRTERVLTAEEQRKKRYEPYPYIPNRFSFDPTGELTFSITDAKYNHDRKAIKDGKATPLESKLNEIIVGFVEVALELKRRSEEQERERREWARREDRARRRRERRERQLKRLEDVEKEATSLARAERLRSYADAVERKTAAGTECGVGAPDAVAWLAWVRRAADWLDPTIRASWPEIEGTANDDEEEAAS